MNDSPLITGWYGKIPSTGDFVSRRLPASFINVWDTWLQHVIVVSRSQLGERWLNLYLTGPIWRFVLLPGVCGDAVWAGILMPSVDKVGRYFPLTVVNQIDPKPGVISAIFSAQKWFCDLEQHALATLDVNISPDDLDNNLARCPFPTIEHNDCVQRFSSWWQADSVSNTDQPLVLPNISLIPELFNIAGEDAFMALGKGRSVWWNAQRETDMMRLRYFLGLPPEDYFSVLLDEECDEGL